MVFVHVFGDFNDSFSDEATSAQNWAESSEKCVVQFMNGACVLTNTDDNYAAYAYHSFPTDEKPSTFTLSGRITFAQSDMEAGFVCCLSTENASTGYYVAISGIGTISVTKIPGGGAASEIVLSVRSAYLNETSNILKVSRKDGVFNVFCNGHFAGTFTDDDLPSGDIALLVSAGGQAVFDDIEMTDTFVQGAPSTCFADDFDDGNLLGWDRFGSDEAEAGLDGDVLRITTGDGENLYQVVDLSLENFVMRAEVTMRGGNNRKLYGLFVNGTAETAIPVAGFGIIGGRSYGTFLSGGNIEMTPSSTIKGAPYVSSGGDTTYYTDTLEVIKREGSDEYLFVINTDTLTRFTGVDFEITGAGIFCLDSLDVAVDNFIVAEGSEWACPVRRDVPVPIKHDRFRVISQTGIKVYDISGRLVSRSALPSHHGRLSAGVYIRRRGKMAELIVNRK